MILGKLRQWRFPCEFRIPDRCPRPVPVPVPQEVPGEPADAVLADLATNLWRVTRKLTGDQDGDAARSHRMAARHAQAARENLADAGIKVQDHDGTPFHPGLSLDVIAYETRPGTTSETVVETVRPSVYRAGRCIQTGQVVVALPAAQSEGVQQHDA